MRLRFIAAAHPEHPLHRARAASSRCRICASTGIWSSAIRGSQRRSGSWLGAEQSWTVSHKATSIHAATMGLGFAWFPEDTVRERARERHAQAAAAARRRRALGELTSCSPTATTPAPGALRLAEIIREHVASNAASSDARTDSPLPVTSITLRFDLSPRFDSYTS